MENNGFESLTGYGIIQAEVTNIDIFAGAFSIQMLLQENSTF